MTNQVGLLGRGGGIGCDGVGWRESKWWELAELEGSVGEGLGREVGAG